MIFAAATRGRSSPPVTFFFLNTFIIGITSLEKPFIRFAYQNTSVKIVSSQKGLSLVLGHINPLLDRSDPSDSRLRLLWAATATSGTALHREDGGGWGYATSPVFLSLL